MNIKDIQSNKTTIKFVISARLIEYWHEGVH